MVQFSPTLHKRREVFSNQLKSHQPQELQNTANKIRSELASTPVEVLYVLAIRLYDVGLKDDAIYWYYTAQFRKNIYAKMVENLGGIGDPAFEFKQTQIAFIQLSGEWINGYAGGVIDTWISIVS